MTGSAAGQDIRPTGGLLSAAKTKKTTAEEARHLEKSRAVNMVGPKPRMHHAVNVDRPYQDILMDLKREIWRLLFMTSYRIHGAPRLGKEHREAFLVESLQGRGYAAFRWKRHCFHPLKHVVDGAAFRCLLRVLPHGSGLEIRPLIFTRSP
jgi:hypothetical protein